MLIKPHLLNHGFEILGLSSLIDDRELGARDMLMKKQEGNSEDLMRHGIPNNLFVSSKNHVEDKNQYDYTIKKISDQIEKTKKACPQYNKKEVHFKSGKPPVPAKT